MGRFISFAALFLCLLLAGGFAMAQNSDVTPFAFKVSPDRIEREVNTDPFSYRGEPIKFKSFLIYPNLTFEQAYKDNLLATDSNEISDMVTRIKPSLIIKKDIGRHEFLLTTEADVNRHWKRQEEDHVNFRTELLGNIEASRAFSIPIELEFRDGHYRREDQRRANLADLTDEPQGITTYTAESGINYKPNRLGVSVIGGFKGVRLDNERFFNSNTPAIRDTRDTNTYSVRVRGSYETGTMWEPFIETTLARENYINLNAGAPDRDNDLIRVLGGATFDYKGLLRGYMGVGYETRNYDDASIDSASGVSAEGKIIWEPTSRNRFQLDLLRRTFEDNLVVAGITETDADLTYSRELRRDLFLKTKLGYEHEDFETANRTDKTLNAGAELLYIIGPQLQIGGEYQYLSRNSTAQGLDLDSSIFLLRLKTNF